MWVKMQRLKSFGSGPSHIFFHSYISSQFTEEVAGAAPVLQNPESCQRSSVTDYGVSWLSPGQ